MVDEKLSQFLDEIIKAKNLPGITTEVHEQLRADMMAKLTDQINAALVQALNSEQTEQLNYMLDQEGVTDEQVQQFFASSGLNTEKIAAQTMLRFRSLYLGSE